MSKDNLSIAYLRAEDIHLDEIFDYYVPFSIDENIVNQIMSISPALLIGSRGTGKTMLLRVAELRLQNRIDCLKVLPLTVSFGRSSFIDPQLFRPWMIAKVLFQLQLKLEKMGRISFATSLFKRYTGVERDDRFAFKIKTFISLIEDAWKSGKGFKVDPINVLSIFGSKAENIDFLNEIDIFKALIEDICNEFGYRRINIFFDEAAHNFIPAQQREFFGLFRDLRSPYLSGVAAVYPGLTSYGHTFQTFHDATLIRVERSIESTDYLESMEKIIMNRVNNETWMELRQNGEALHALIYAASGNPRLLLKSLLMGTNNLRSFKTALVNDTIRTFYRSDIWNEHTRLSGIYAGHKPLVDWGRSFIESSVLPETKKKNDDRARRGDNTRTIYFVVNKDVPQAVKSSLSILEYTGLVTLVSEGVKMTRSQLGNRYALNIGCLLAQETNPILKAIELRKYLDPRRFTEYGFKHAAFDKIDMSCSLEVDTNMSSALAMVLNKPVQELDLSEFQLNKLVDELGVQIIGDILKMTEEDLQRAPMIGEKRARRIMSVALNAALEYVSG